VAGVVQGWFEEPSGGDVKEKTRLLTKSFLVFLAPPGRNLTFLHLVYAMKIRF
jgi:cytochrome bd-type quinol oxidase subunit 1